MAIGSERQKEEKSKWVEGEQDENIEGGAQFALRTQESRGCGRSHSSGNVIVTLR